MGERARGVDRRTFLKRLGLGAGALALAGGRPLAGAFARSGREAVAPRFAGEELFPDFPLSQLYRKVEAPSRVSLIKGESRYDIVLRSLKLIEDDDRICIDQYRSETRASLE